MTEHQHKQQEYITLLSCSFMLHFLQILLFAEQTPHQRSKTVCYQGMVEMTEAFNIPALGKHDLLGLIFIYVTYKNAIPAS
jgi:hypothetical protein